MRESNVYTIADNVRFWRKAVVVTEEAKAGGVFHHPPPPCPCNPAQPVRSGAGRRCQRRISNGLRERQTTF